jgi:phosphatidylinositol alpha-1,6-mannosyltransferase
LRDQPKILVVGHGSIGGIGRFERLFVNAMEGIDRESGMSFTSIWRSAHPGYLTSATGGRERDTPEPASSAYGFAARIVAAELRQRPDVTIFLHPNLARGAALAGPLRPGRYVVVAHGVEVWAALDPLRRRALRRATSVWSVSEYTSLQVEARHGVRPERARVLSLALEPHWSKDAAHTPPSPGAAPGESGPLILSVSRLEQAARDKGIDDVIRALPEVRLRFPSIRYHIVGDGSDRAYLEQLADGVGVSDLVMFRGLLPHDQLVAEYQATDLFVLPSLREGFGLVFLEAMIFAKPVLARNAAATGELVLDGTTGVLQDDSASIGPALVRLLSDPTRLRQMGLAGRERAENLYSFETFKSRLSAALSEAIR